MSGHKNYDLPPDVTDCLLKEGYTVLSWVNKGSFANVYQARYGQSYYAIKAIALRSDKKTVNIEHEMKISSALSHQNIVKTHEVIEIKDRFVLFINDFAETDLLDLIDKEEELSEQTVKRWFAQVVDAVNYLHQNHIAHRDIKPENVLLHEDRAKLTDFGLSEFAPDGRLVDNFRGTYEYSSPENLNCIIEKTLFDPFVSDVYSLGALLYIMITSDLPFGSSKRLRTKSGVKRLQKKQSQEKWKLTEDIENDRHLYSLLKQLMNPNVSSRIRCRQILSHPWFHK